VTNCDELDSRIRNLYSITIDYLSEKYTALGAMDYITPHNATNLSVGSCQTARCNPLLMVKASMLENVTVNNRRIISSHSHILEHSTCNLKDVTPLFYAWTSTAKHNDHIHWLQITPTPVTCYSTQPYIKIQPYPIILFSNFFGPLVASFFQFPFFFFL
jgi:hypothetical protein